MAFFEDALGGWTGGLVLGVGTALLGPSILPAAGAIVRPLAKAVIKGGYLVADGVRTLAAEVSEQTEDLIAEARADRQPVSRASERRPAPSPIVQP